jgi:hypothetical protein
MQVKKPYVSYKFIGVKPFTNALDEANIRYVLFDDESPGRIFHDLTDYFNPGEDSISIGRCIQENADAYFAEFGIKITPSYRSYLVFIYDHHPSVDEMLISATDIESIIQEYLDGVDMGEIKMPQ